MYEDIIEAKKYFDEHVLNSVKTTIEKSVQEAKEKKLNWAQAYINIMTNIDNNLRAIKHACGMNEAEPFNEDLERKIMILTDPYDEKKNEYIQMYINELLNSYNVKELLDKCQVLQDIIENVKEWGSNPYEIPVKPKQKTKKKKKKNI